MDCHETVELLSAHLDHELSASEEQRVRDHLRDCCACRRRQAMLAVTQDVLRRWPQETVSSAFDASLHSKLRAVRSRRARGWNLHGFGRVALGLAAVLIVAALSVLLRGPLRHTRPALPERTSIVPVDTMPGADCGIVGASTCFMEVPCMSEQSCGSLRVPLPIPVG
jgi:anti-sigma factor RsiW